MAVVKKYISRLLLGIFLFAITPHELLHDLAGHYDTVDPIHAVTSVSVKHIHCEILQLQLLPFSTAAVFFSLTPSPVVHSLIASPVTIKFSVSAIEIATRGPPAC